VWLVFVNTNTVCVCVCMYVRVCVCVVGLLGLLGWCLLTQTTIGLFVCELVFVDEFVCCFVGW